MQLSSLIQYPQKIFKPECTSHSLFLVFVLFWSILILSSFSGSGNENRQRAASNENNSHEKIYLHIERSEYQAGDDIWFKVYLVDANSHKPEAESKVVYVELIDPANKITGTKIVKITDGCGTGDFKLPFDFIKGEYQVRAYTNYMRNFDDAWFFRGKVFVNSMFAEKLDSAQQKSPDKKSSFSFPELKPDLQFFPDGGSMVDGLVNQVGFKAVGADGKGIAISGIIVDNTGEKVMDFQSLKFGLGKLKFVPQKDKSYKAQVLLNGLQYSYDLPVSLASGVVMEIIEQKDLYTAIIRSALPNGVNDFKFVGRQKNKFVGSSKITNNLEGAKITIPKNILEEGIVQFTLFDNQDKPVCERLVFVEKDENHPVVTISSAKASYGKRELVELDISPDIQKNRTFKANASLSVTEVSALDSSKFGLDIRSYLLLNSDLRGEIEHPGYYFYSDDSQRKKLLDLLMMTQGWRQFILNDSLNIVDGKLNYSIETGINIGGSVRRFSDQGKPAKAEVSLVYSNKDEMVYNQTESDNKGHFLFEDFDFLDSTSVIIQAKKVTKDNEGIKNPNGNFFITMDSITSPKISNPKIQVVPVEDTFKVSPPVNSLSAQEIDSILHDQHRHILLDEVTITTRKIERMAQKRLMYREPSNSLDFKEIRKSTAARNVLDALEGRIPGLDFNGEDLVIGGDHSINRGGPLFLLNGIPTTKDAILAIPVDQIDFVDVLKRGKTIVFGSAGSHGVIAVYTLAAADNLENDGKSGDKCIVNFTHPGFSIARKFYEPVYSSGKSVQNKPDYRSTIYWNPEVKLTDQGKTKLSFYTSELPATYKVDLEGITSEGVPVHSETFFEVK